MKKYKSHFFFSENNSGQTILASGIAVAMIALIWNWKPINQSNLNTFGFQKGSLPKIELQDLSNNLAENNSNLSNDLIIANQNKRQNGLEYDSSLVFTDDEIDPEKDEESMIEPSENIIETDFNSNEQTIDAFKPNVTGNEIPNALAENDVTIEEIQPINVATETATILRQKSATEHTIMPGDTLLSVLTEYGISKPDVFLISRQHKQLVNLRVGNKLSWKLDNKKRLVSLTLTTPAEQQEFIRSGDNFNKKIEIAKGPKRTAIIAGDINGGFMQSARNAGLTQSEIGEVVKALQWQFDFKKVKNNDKFVVQVEREYSENDSVKRSQLLGVKFSNGKDNYYSIGFNGRYYNKEGMGLSKGFLRYPLKTVPRVSSQFNPNRLHPVTRKVAPHRGVDFAVPTGTQIIAPADGEITLARYSSSAGHYITIKHGEYVTRYMHLSKLLVQPGQKVKQGMLIGLSGNSGRSTGPHLHYEIHVDNVPQDPLKVRLPRSETLTGKAKTAFATKAQEVVPNLS